MLKKYDIPFEDLFDSKEQAVLSFLSLERRYLALHKANMVLEEQLNKMITRFGNWFLERVT